MFLLENVISLALKVLLTSEELHSVMTM